MFVWLILWTPLEILRNQIQWNGIIIHKDGQKMKENTKHYILTGFGGTFLKDKLKN